jgi:hypothetical protein
MSLRAVGWIAGITCVVGAWGVVVALTYEKTGFAIACGAAIAAGVAVFVAQGVALQKELNAARREIDIRMIEAAKRAEGLKNPGDSGVNKEGNKPGGTA